MGKYLYNKLRNEEEWTIERIRALWIYRQETKQLDAPYEIMPNYEEFDKLGMMSTMFLTQAIAEAMTPMKEKSRRKRKLRH